MHLTHLTLSNFRSYVHMDLQLPAGSILLHGANAQGKTTLLEAVYYLATSRSPHASQDRQLINWYAAQNGIPLTVGRLTAEIQSTGETRPRKLEVRLIHENNGQKNGPVFRREALVNGVKVRLMDLLGNLNVVLFLPDDVDLVTASPNQRRRYLDITLCQVDRHYCQTLSQYNKVLSQRNALLRSLSENRRRVDWAEFAHWDQKLTELGARIMLRRSTLIADLERRAGEIHFDSLTGGAESLRLVYHPRLQARSGDNHRTVLPAQIQDDPAGWLLASSPPEVTDVLRDLLRANRQIELRRSSTLVGPHLDDVDFLVNGRSLADYGSRGQQRTAVLALKLAEVSWMEAQTGEQPVLLLDEVLAELDQSRRAFLLDAIGSAEQAILTATDPSMFTDQFLAQATRLEVSGGNVTPMSSQMEPE